LGVQGRTREQLAVAHVEVDTFRSQLEVSEAKLQRLERSNAHLRKQRAQMMADFQVSFALSCCISAQHHSTSACSKLQSSECYELKRCQQLPLQCNT
jgi:hypothetical protein